MGMHFKFSSMNAGKSANLLQVAYNYEESGFEVIVGTSVVDDRSGVGVVASRTGMSRPARVFDGNTNFEDWFQGKKLSCILLDEAQFLEPSQVAELHRCSHLYAIPVICFGLRTDFKGEAFPGSAALLALADRLEELRAICKCGKRATMQIRVDEQGNRLRAGPQLEIGGNNRYRQVCGKCFYS